MTVEDFWNRAFLAALARTDPEQAKLDADRATELCIAHWKAEGKRTVKIMFTPVWKDQDVAAAN